MYARFALIITAAMLVAAALAPTALAASSALPVELAPGEEVVSHTTSSEKDSQYIVELLSSIKGVKIGADKTTVLINDGDTTHPIEIDYSNAVSSGSKGGVAGKLGASEAFAAGKDGAAAKNGETAGSSADGAGASGSGGGVGLGQIAGLLIGLTVVSRVIGIVRQLGAGSR